ncbi:MAG: PQQ-binding-like beta-propeller repeat protein [Pseudomonadota bacterium]|nr:PQQ-binding-like beta-propeller repeat protein [Pseudomonadota bacterium]
MHKQNLFCILFIIFLSSACGGGGGGSSDNTPSITGTGSGSGSGSGGGTTTNANNACVVGNTGAPEVLQQKMWPHYSSDQFASRYIDSDKLDKNNYTNLTIAWTWEAPSEKFMDENPTLVANRNAATPIMVDGVLFTTSQFNHVNAINAETGNTIWEFDPVSYSQGQAVNHGFIHRGLAYWEKDGEKRLLIGTLDGFLYSLDACTGEVDLQFSNGGKVDLKDGLGVAVTDNLLFGINAPPLVCKDTVVVGSSIIDWPDGSNWLPPGDVRAYDIITGQLKWQFHVIPHEGEFGEDTWENDSNLNAAGANVWSTFSCDESLNTVYLPTSTPTNDHWGGDRLGDGLFGETIVALDIDTGERKWHFQTVHHGLWDYDLPAAPNLVNVTTSNGVEKLLAQVSKQAFLYVFDRETGQPKWPIVETSVPQTNEVGEQTSSTQPIPSKPLPFDHQGVNLDNLIDFTPSLRSQALDIISQWDYGDLYTPPTKRGTLTVPSITGGASWSGATYHPDKNILYVPSGTFPFVTSIERSGLQTLQNRDYVHGPQGLPLMKPPYARITAISMETGEHVWVSAVGRNYENSAALSGVTINGDLGAIQRVHAITTKNLLITGQQRLTAFDLDTGEKIGEISVPNSVVEGNLMAYELNDKLYIIVPVGGGESSRGPKSQLIAYKLN